MRLQNDEVIVTTATAEDLEELQELHKEACGYFKFDTERPLTTPKECLERGELPENGKPENYELLTIRINDTMIGYIGVYREFPSRNAVHIMSLYIGQSARGFGFGSRVMELVCRYFYETAYRSICARVSLSNWGALRFLYRHGFNGLRDCVAPGAESDGCFGCIELSRDLTKRV